MEATIVIPVFNQLGYTRQCLESLNDAGYDDSTIVIVNNASTDGTAKYLSNRPCLRVVHNQENRACAAAWNQGFQESRTAWTAFLNNDTVVTAGWVEALIRFAQLNDIGVASPAMGEGKLDYDLPDYARKFTTVMMHSQRRRIAYGAAFLVSRRVMEAIGGFDENFRHAGDEDIDFFWRVKRAGFKLAISGCAYIHHFGLVTQRAVAASLGKEAPYRDETHGYLRKKWRMSWSKRRLFLLRRRIFRSYWKLNERLRHGHTLLEIRDGRKISYR